MGIDIYLRWPEMTPDEKQRQICGYSTRHGHVGYLREAYHGHPCATRVLVPEAFNDRGDGIEIPAAVLRERLPRVLDVVKLRSLAVYGEDAPADALQAFDDFVRLAEEKEAHCGRPCTVQASY